MEVDTVTAETKGKRELIVYLAVRKEDCEQIERTKKVYVHTYGGPRKCYVGLRESPDDALSRAASVFNGKLPVDKTSFDLLKLRFTEAGVAKYTLTTGNPMSYYSSTLHKLVYPNDTSLTDYGAWAFVGDLPIEETDDHGGVLISYERAVIL